MSHILSLIDFYEKFKIEEDCFNYLVAVRWTNGFFCPKCGCTRVYLLKSRALFQCKACRHQTSVTAGTIFHKLRQPLHKLFMAVYLFATSKKGISAMELQRKLGFRTYRTAWTLLHKLRKAMTSSGLSLLTDQVEVDETYIGGYRPGKPGRGAEDKDLVVVAVETTSNDNLGKAYLKQIPEASSEVLGKFVHDHVRKGTMLKTDGFASYCHLSGDYDHQPHPQGVPQNAGKLLPKVHIVIGNLKSWLSGTFNRYPSSRYLSAYLTEFEFRFNRRWNLAGIFDKLLKCCIHADKVTLAELMA